MFGRKRRERKQVAAVTIFTYNCIGCGACVSRCRRNVLKMVTNGSCQYAVVENYEECVGCGKCMRVCPVGAVELIVA